VPERTGVWAQSLIPHKIKIKNTHAKSNIFFISICLSIVVYNILFLSPVSTPLIFLLLPFTIYKLPVLSNAIPAGAS